MLDHRRGGNFCRIGPTLAQELPAPSGLRLGMHCSMIIALSMREQSLAANGEERALKGIASTVNRMALLRRVGQIAEFRRERQ